MPKRPSSVFIVALTVATALTILGDTLGITWLHYACKPLIMLLLLAFAWQQNRRNAYSTQVRWLLTGMVFALAGDVFLMIRERDLFAPGLGAFLVMQLCYSRAFYLSGRQSSDPVARRFLGLMLLLFGLYDGAFLYVLRPAFNGNPTLTPLWWPVVVYAACLSLMGLLATLRPKRETYGWVVAGALLFILSDSLIAINKFLFPLPGSAFFVMSTYAAGQYLIVAGMIYQIRAEVELAIH